MAVLLISDVSMCSIFKIVLSRYLRRDYLICISAHDKILISLQHQIQYRVNNSMIQGTIYEKWVKFVETLHFGSANKDLKTSAFRSRSK